MGNRNEVGKIKFGAFQKQNYDNHHQHLTTNPPSPFAAAATTEGTVHVKRPEADHRFNEHHKLRSVILL